MERYRDIDGDSGVQTFEVGDDFIVVQFTKGRMYLYTYSVTGSYHVNNMIKLARTGTGLNRYINLNAKKSYARKLA